MPPASRFSGDPKDTLSDLTAAVRERMTNVDRDAARDRLKTIRDAIRTDRESLVSKARKLADQVAHRAFGITPCHRGDIA